MVTTGAARGLPRSRSTRVSRHRQAFLRLGPIAEVCCCAGRVLWVLAVLEHDHGSPPTARSKTHPGWLRRCASGCVPVMLLLGAGAYCFTRDKSRFLQVIANEGAVTTLAFAPDERLLAIGTSAGAVAVWCGNWGDARSPGKVCVLG